MPLARSRSTALRLETLEGREVPASLQIVFDYRYDSTGFFGDPNKRAVLEQAGRDIASRLNTSVVLAAVAPAGGNTWTATTFDPAHPTQYVSLTNLSVGTDQMVVFVGAEAGAGGGEAGLGGFGGYSANGSNEWLAQVRTRGRGGFAPWGGSIAFSSTTNWYVGTGAPAANQIDFYSVASHELGHVLGFGTANQWNGLVSGNAFTGANARAANGGTNPRVDTSDWGHWQQGTAANGQVASMQPVINAGTRVPFSALDFAALADIGWEVGGAVGPAAAPVVSSPPPSTSPILAAGQTPVVVGGSDGTFRVYTVVAGQLTPVGGAVTPFAGFGGAIRTATGDVNGDGVQDVIAAAGPGGAPVVKVYDGRTGGELSTFLAFEPAFRGGVLVAAGDLNGDGRADVVAGADEGGGPRVRVFDGGNPNAVMADFWGIDDVNFRGGARVAVGDLNRDGRAELVAAAGPGGGPRVAVYDGGTFTPGRSPERFVWDFVAYDPWVRDGAYVAVADVDGDGFGDVTFGPGAGAAHVKTISGAALTRTRSGAAAVNAPIASYAIPQPGGYDAGARVAAGDFNGDGRDEVAVGTGAGAAGVVYLTNAAGGVMSATAVGGLQPAGVYVG